MGITQAAMDTLDRAPRAANAAGGTLAGPVFKKRSKPLKSAPPQLLHFVREGSVSDAARELGLTRATVYRLRDGYWPGNPANILQAWARFKAGRGALDSWFLRRVRAGGVVRHAGQDFSAPGLPARTGQILAVARDTDGNLLAQTLELPAERIALTAAYNTQH
ncbi:MAG: hypothetical protein RSD57_16175 [Comamonas sp.]